MRKEYDVIVAGAGTAGAIAGIAAARTGAKTLVIDQYGSIGGILQLGMSLFGVSDGEGYLTLGGIGGELLERLHQVGGGTKTSHDSLFSSVTGHDPEMTKLTLVDMACQSNVEFLLHTFVADVVMDGTRIKGVVVANKGGLQEIRGKCFVDCTGDADITARSKGEFTVGREGDSLMQPVSAVFRIGGIDFEALFDYIEQHPEEMNAPEGFTGTAHTIESLRSIPGISIVGFKNTITKARAAGDFDIPHDVLGLNTLPDRNEVAVNVTRVHGIDGTNPEDVTRAEIETQRQTMQVMLFLKKYIPGFETARIISAPYQVGIRETRHIKGAYVLNQNDVLEGRDFEDQIGRGAYPLDVHDVKPGSEMLGRVVKGNSTTLHTIFKSYGIPARCLIPLGVENVTVGGRSISATHAAAGSIRGQSVCMATGHAAGTMAALAAMKGISPLNLPISELQAVLRSQGAILERSIKIDSIG